LTEKSEPVPRKKIVEASIWVARLQSDKRDSSVDRDFRAWLDASETNRAAFEMASESWELAGGARVTRPRHARWWRTPSAAAAFAVVIAFLGIGIWHAERPLMITTTVGEQRSLRLADGSVIMLNTATTLATSFNADHRLIKFDYGEASFEVAKDSLRPFIVQAGDTRVVAVGTVFDVRYLHGALWVTLAEGKVRVVRRLADGETTEVEMSAGQRLLIAMPKERPTLRAVNLQTARAWRGGQVVFGGTPLGEAVAEMNRYSDHPITIDDPSTAQLKISGAFRTIDGLQFARAVSDLYGLTLSDNPKGPHLGKALIPAA
jgi:transmembrane sensor